MVSGASEMVQKDKDTADPSLIPGTYIMEGKNWLLEDVFYMCL